MNKHNTTINNIVTNWVFIHLTPTSRWEFRALEMRTSKYTHWEGELISSKNVAVFT